MTLTEKTAFDDYISQRNSNQIDAYGNPVGDRGDGINLFYQDMLWPLYQASRTKNQSKLNYKPML